jgi:hypothetical protein
MGVLLVGVGGVLVAGSALGAIVGPMLGEQNAGDWATVLVALVAGLAALGVGFALARR